MNGASLCSALEFWNENGCQPKRNYTDLCNTTDECHDLFPMNLLCQNGTCLCSGTDFWNGVACQPKGNYTDACDTTGDCRDFTPVNLICRNASTIPATLQCLCNSSSFWDSCLQRCITLKTVRFCRLIRFYFNE